MKYLIVCGVLGGLLSFTAQAAQLPLGADVPGLLLYAKAHNPELAAMQYDADAAYLRIQPAGALPDPVLRMELMNITNQGSDKSASLLPSGVGYTRYLLAQSIPWFGKLDLQSEVARAQARGASRQTAVTWADLSVKIKSAYAIDYYLSDNIRLTREMLDLTRNLENIARTRYANGLGAQQEVIRAQLEKTDLQTQLIDLNNEQHHAHVRLNVLLSRPANAELAAPQQLRALPAAAQLDSLADKLRANNPGLQVAEISIDEARKNRELIYKNRYPGITLGIAPNQYGNTLRSWDMMVEFNIPLQQASRRSQEGEAEAKLAASTSRRRQLLDQLLSALSESISSLEAASNTDAIITTSLLPQSELNFQSALSGYTNGRTDFATLLDAQRQILKVRSLHFKAQYDAQLQLAEIERLTGEEL